MANMYIDDLKNTLALIDEVSSITLTCYEGELTEALATALEELLSEYKNLKEENRKLKQEEREEIYEYGD